MCEFDLIWDALTAGDLTRLAELACEIDDFPQGQDDFIQRYWITNAIDSGSFEVVRWMLAEGAPVVFEAPDEDSVLHSAIERDLPDRHEILRVLIDAGADLHARGRNDWTPAHLAANFNDVESLKILKAAGADLTIRSRIDNEETPLDEAIHAEAKEAVAYLRGHA